MSQLLSRADRMVFPWSFPWTNPARYSAFRSLGSFDTTVMLTIWLRVSITPEAFASRVKTVRPDGVSPSPEQADSVKAASRQSRDIHSRLIPNPRIVNSFDLIRTCLCVDLRIRTEVMHVK